MLVKTKVTPKPIEMFGKTYLMVNDQAGMLKCRKCVFQVNIDHQCIKTLQYVDCMRKHVYFIENNRKKQ